MLTDSEPLQWQNDYMAWCQKRINLPHWNVTLKINDKLLVERETTASVDIHSNMYYAVIYVRSDTQNDIEGRERIAHEMYHILMVGFDDINRAMMNCISDATAEPLKYLYECAQEQLVTMLARSLAREGFDG